MVCKDTLRIKHLPKELTDTQKEHFIRHFGALKVKVITSKAKAKSIVYAKFENEDIAKNVMARLHQISILNCRVSVEYAETDILQGQLSNQKVEVHEGPDKRFLKNFINNVNAFNDSVGFHQPPPSHLKYNYPKANRATINNIGHALATVPRFYTQVLHLMNKMNLPPPFAMPEPPLHSVPFSQLSSMPLRSNQIGEKRKLPSSSESELESDGDGEGKQKDIVPEKRKLTQKKPLKRPKFITQEVTQGAAPSKSAEKAEAVFDKVDVQPQKKIELIIQERITVENPIVKPLEHSVVSEEASVEKLIVKPVVEPVVSESTSMLPEAKSCVEDTRQTQKLSKISPEKKAEKRREDVESVNRSVSPSEKQATAHVVESDNVQVDTPEVEKRKSIIDDLQCQESLPVDMETVLPLPSQEELNVSTLIDEKDSEVHFEQPPQVQAQEANIAESVVTQHGILLSKVDVLQDHSQTPIEIVAPIQEPQPEKVPLRPVSPEDEFPCISLDELRANQVTDLTVMAVFKNYNPGEPTNKVYIKNCAKTVVVQDLEYIFNRYREEGTEEKPSEFNIRLMQEGRMKGQAFVTLDSVEQAQKAVNETNGFILKDKPLVVVFGKTGKKK